ncbi:MAG: argininosuccinate lyase [Chitinophagales bacterium]|nr:argininosuccinate lyase [Chitinophagales bacterium]
MSKLWQKDNQDENALSSLVEAFTVGQDKELDVVLASFDVLGSLAHTQMLSEVGLLTTDEKEALHEALKKIYKQTLKDNFTIGDGIEDIHSEVEFRLTEQLGEIGKKIHSGRSRNDQILLDLKLFARNELLEISLECYSLFNQLIELSNTHKDKLLPGYTHLQLAMPSSFGLWFAAYAESLVDDMQMLYTAFKVANKNPLGSGAGYGSSFPLNRNRTTELLGFESLNYNVVYAQMNRGKLEKTCAIALSNIAATLSKMAMDCCLYMNQNFGFINFPDELTTGSSIMPHKKNPDVWELIRAKCNKLQSLPNQFTLILNNLPSGYHRDLQIIKEDFIYSFTTLKSCLQMTQVMLNHIKIEDNILKDTKYTFLFTVDSVNELVNEGMSFRDAYVAVGKQVENGSYKKPKKLNHTLEGSLGNLYNDEIKLLMQTTFKQFPMQHIYQSIDDLLK